MVSSPFPKGFQKITDPKFAFSDDRQAGNYFRLTSDNRLLWGRGITTFGIPNRFVLEESARKDIKMYLPNLESICYLRS